ncbi:hypothetical protein IQ06DRAFT_938 [Phaeosphaeriaceae sp. SRC1lsM3a]|nr:hypothetical protein IQ06DRAFT_938 [Stagonospora sp. SRC1lsM3a]
MIASCSQSATGTCGISASFQPLLSSCYTGIVHHESTSSIFTSSIYLRTCCTSNDVFRPPHTSEHPAAGLKLTNVNAELESDNACQFYGAKGDRTVRMAQMRYRRRIVPRREKVTGARSRWTAKEMRISCSARGPSRFQSLGVCALIACARQKPRDLL